VDAWRYLHPKKRDWTYAQFAKEEPRPYRQAARLDTFLVREGLVNRIIKCEIMKSEHTGSDHRAMQIEYKLDRIQLAERECYRRPLLKTQRQKEKLKTECQYIWISENEENKQRYFCGDKN
jgi:hypothetical protein